MSLPLPQQLSVRIRFWSFVSMLLLVYVHGYNLNDRFLHPWTMPGEAMTVTAFLEYLFANGLLRFRIPMLFAVSGYLFALRDGAPYGPRIARRAKTLLLPHLLWTGASLAAILLIEQSAFGRSLVAATNLLRLDEQRALLSQHAWYEALARLTVATPSYQFWFIRALFVYNLLYPFLRWWTATSAGRWSFFPLAVALWLLPVGVPFIEGEGFLFFTLGVVLQKRGADIGGTPPLMPVTLWAALFITTSVLKTLIAFHAVPFPVEAAPPVMLLLHKTSVLTGLIAAWFGLSSVAAWCMERRWFAWSSAFSFVIYAAHAPFIAFAVDAYVRTAGHLPFARLAGFILLPALIILLSIALGAAMRRWTPSVYGVMTGGRGMM